MKFSDIGLDKNIQKGIADLGFENPTPIQYEVIPFLLSEESDLIGLAQTGTGKTAKQANCCNNIVSYKRTLFANHQRS